MYSLPTPQPESFSSPTAAIQIADVNFLPILGAIHRSAKPAEFLLWEELVGLAMILTRIHLV
jgi:hypothetical protein